MSAPPPPTDREAQNAVTPAMLKAAWATWKARHGGKLGPGPAFVEAIAAALAVGPLVELAELRSKLAAVEGEQDKVWGEAEAAERFATRHFIRAENAAVERDALAGMAGEGFAEWAKALAGEQESHRIADIMAEVGFGKMVDAGDEAREIRASLAAADSRAREAGAWAERAERAEAALRAKS